MPSVLLEKVLESVGGVDGLRQRGDQFRQDLAFIEENREKLLKDYNETWVAVYRGEVVAHARNYNRIVSQLRKRNLPVDRLPIRYLSKRKVFALY